MSEQERVQRAHAAQRYASSQGARALVIPSVMELVVPQAFGAYDAIALKARWGAVGVQPQFRAFVATTRGEREAKP